MAAALVVGVLDAFVRGCTTAGLAEAEAARVPHVPFADLLPSIGHGVTGGENAGTGGFLAGFFNQTAWRTFSRFALADGPLALSYELQARGVIQEPWAYSVGGGDSSSSNFTESWNSSSSSSSSSLPVYSYDTAGGVSATLSGVRAGGVLGGWSAAGGLDSAAALGDLSFAQLAWLRFWSFCGSDQATLLWTYVVMNVFYVLFAATFFSIDFSHVLDSIKLQPEPERHPGLRHYWMCLKNLIKNYIVVILPIVYCAHPLFRYLGFSSGLDLPSLSTCLWQWAFFVWAEDFTHFFLHWALHLKWLYPYIHKMHHEFSTPFGLAASYAHPIEVLVLGFCTFSGPLVVGPHYVVFYPWIIYRQLDAVFTHCGYDLPGITDLIPFYGGAPAHDLHHRKFLCNYSSRFTYLDLIFGTYKSPKAEHERVMRIMAQREAAGGDAKKPEAKKASGVSKAKTS